MTATKHIRLALMNERIDALLHARAMQPDKTPPTILYDAQEGPHAHGRSAGRRLGVGSVVPGLRLRIGPRTATWFYFEDRQDKRRITKDNPRGRVVVSKTLGAYDFGVADGKARKRAEWHMNTEAARAAASILRGQVAGGEAPDGKRDAVTFREALEGKTDAQGHRVPGYLDRLQAKADNNGKRARWRANVKAISDKHILPRWGGYPLADLSEMRQAVGEWYNALAADTPSTALHCRQIIRAVYLWKRKAGAKLPADHPALAEIDRKPAYKTKPGKRALARLRTKPVNQFPAWLAAWRTLPTPMVRAYWLFLIFTGQRPGEALGLKWEHVDHKHNTITIQDAKAGNDIVFPMSEQIRRVLDLAKEAAGDVESDLVFFGPNAEHWSHRDAPLGVPGQGMRRTFKTAGATLGYLDEMTERLIGHLPESASTFNYEDGDETQSADFLAGIQAKVSARIVELLGSDPTREKFKPLPPSARDVARAAGRETYKGDQECPAGHIGLRYVSTNRCVACVAAKNFRQKANRASSRRKKRLDRAELRA